jgi:butyrate kinase
MTKAARRNLIVVVNPGATSTKIAVYRGSTCLVCELINHSKTQLARFNSISAQYAFRRDTILKFLSRRGFALETCSAVIGRGGLTKPISGGIYRVNAHMLRDLGSGRWGEHASNLGAPIAAELAQRSGAPAFVADPPVVDELSPLARYAGHPALQRKSLFHALSQRAAARHAARELGVSYERSNFIVVHMGAGISVGAHQKGQVIDVNNALDGDGPFSPERSGSLPAGDLVRLCFSRKYSLKEAQKMIVGAGGLFAYLGTNDCRVIEGKIRRGNKHAREVYQAMAYQTAKAVGAAAAALSGKVHAVVLTGGASRSRMLVGFIRKYAGFVAPFRVYPEMEEMSALALFAQAAIKGKIKVKEYC